MVVFICMELKELKLKIEETGYFDNIKIGNYFHMKYPIIYSEIKKITSCLNNSLYNNTLFRARIILISDCIRTKVLFFKKLF